MNIIELKSQICHKNLSNFYVFVGEEIGIINLYLHQMSKICGLNIVREDSVSIAYQKCSNNSILSHCAKSLYVVRNDTDFPKQDKYFDNIKGIKGSIIVLLYDKLDSRLKFSKHFKDDIVVFEKLTPSIIQSYITKELPLTSENCQTLIDVCNGSYDMCMLEVDKIKSYMNQKGRGLEDANLSFKELLDDGTIYQQETGDVFMLSNLVSMRDVQDSFRVAQILLDNNVSSINILGTLYNSLRTIMLVQANNGKPNVCETTGLDNRQVYFTRGKLNKYTISELVEALKLISRVVDGIKRGVYEDAYSVKYVLCNIL